MAEKIQIRRDTAASWTSVNPTLANGEIGFETDTYRLKIGDGVTVWTSLDYYYSNDGKASIDSSSTPDYIGSADDNGIIRVDSTLDYTDGGDYITIGLDSTLKTNYDTAYSQTHTQDHDIDSTSDHNGVSGATENNLIAFNADGLPKDSGIAISTVTSGVIYKGTWNANTNTPTLSNSGGGGTQGDYYLVNVSGTTNIDGEDDWVIGDWIIHNGTIWDKVDNSSPVISVNTQTGAVVLDADDIDDSSTSHKFVSQTQIDAFHTQDHDIDSTSDHNGVSGATENNFMSFNANGLPKDSGKSDSDYVNIADNGKVGIDSSATLDYIGSSGSDGAIRVDTTLDYTDGGNYITLGLDSGLKTAYDIAYLHGFDTSNPHGVTTTQISAEPAFSKNNAFNKNFGTTVDTVCEGNDSRLSDARTPTAHASTHTDGTDDIASFSGSGSKGLVPDPTVESGYFLRDDGTWAAGGGGVTNTVTGSNGITNTGTNIDADLEPTYGTTSNTICQGNDSRLSDARTPTAHNTSHQNGGSDEINVAGLSGQLADAQKINIEDDGSSVTDTPHDRLDFKGDGVQVANDGGGQAGITIHGTNFAEFYAAPDQAMSGSWATITLNNTRRSNTADCSLSSNIITLQPGVHLVTYSVDAYKAYALFAGTERIALRVRENVNGGGWSTITDSERWMYFSNDSSPESEQVAILQHTFSVSSGTTTQVLLEGQESGGNVRVWKLNAIVVSVGFKN